MFDGSNPLDWIFQAENYFTYYNIPENRRLSLSVFYVTGAALSWYKYLHNNALLGRWRDFSRALELRFGHSDYENHQAALFKLKQTTTVMSYQSERYYPGHKCNPPQFLLIADNEPFDHDEVDPNSTENFPTPATLQPTNPNQFFALSSAAFFGLSSAQALRVTGFINNKPVQVLIDSGSTHNIIQPRIVSFLNLPKQDIPEFAVMVGNGESLKCQAVCPSISLAIQDASFNIPVFVLPVAGADVILGIAWLQTLGPVLADFAIPQLTFNVGPKAITLRGEPLST